MEVSSPTKRPKAQNRHLILSRSDLRTLVLYSGLPSQFVTIDFESFFDCQPSEVAMSCELLLPSGKSERIASLHALIAPTFALSSLSQKDRGSLEHVQRKVTGIPCNPVEPTARRDLKELFLEMMRFIEMHDKMGVLFGKACQLEARSLHFLADAAGVDKEKLPMLAECQDMVELIVKTDLSHKSFNAFVKEFPFDVKVCCPFHLNLNERRVEKNKEPFHCALQDAVSFGELMVGVKQHLELLTRIDAVEREKERILQEEKRRKDEEERLLLVPGVEWGVFRCRGKVSRLLIGRSPGSGAEVQQLEQVAGVTMIATTDTDVDLILDSDLGIHQIRQIDNFEDLERELKVEEKQVSSCLIWLFLLRSHRP
jgi:hypothetical protein